MTSLLVRMFEHNRWANLRAVDACAGLTDATLNATVAGTAGSVRDTLMHMASAEQRYVWRLSGRQPTYGERDGWPGSATLQQAFDESGHELITLAEHANPDAMQEGEYAGFPVAIIYVQVINHATEHRSQIATILTQQGVKPPDFSGWAWGDHTFS